MDDYGFYGPRSVFGEDIDVLCTGQRERIPKMVKQSIKWMLKRNAHKCPGIFSEPGAASKVEHIKVLFNRTPQQKIKLSKEKPNAHTVGYLLKRFFEEQPEPLLTYKWYRGFLIAQKSSDILVRLRQMRVLVQRCLSPARRRTLIYLLHFLKKVSRHAERNDLTLQKLAEIWAPVLLQPITGKSKESERLAAVNAVKILIDYADYVATECNTVLSNGVPTTPAEGEDDSIIMKALEAFEKDKKRLSKRGQL